MFSYIVGNIDWPAAFVLAGLFVGIGIASIVFMTTHKTKDDIEIEKMKLQNQHEEQLYVRETWRVAEMKKVELGQITSHREAD